ncbi:MAG TPA: family 10 glycosylhydrolase, partial [Armatimonadota bacterium]|nr:family 10 glycosylhydrolase [Armatimonadota bacterium]
MIRIFLILGALGMTFITAQVKAGDYTGAISAAGGLQGRVLWCDAEANIWALDSREKVAELAEKCKEANFNTIVVDVKPLSGVVLYNSKVAPRLTIWNGRPYPQNYDLLQVMVEECRRVGIEVHAAVNVFSEA